MGERVSIAENTPDTGNKIQHTLVLASTSPRRLSLLRQLGFSPLVVPVDIAETVKSEESAQDLVLRLARSKADACHRELSTSALTDISGSTVVLGADTVIELDGEILGKPVDKAHALSMLAQLSGREHRVLTGVCVLQLDGSPSQTIAVSTRVEFATITPDIALSYWNSGEPQGKAGAYAIQGIGAQFVVHLSGSYSNVVGLPLFETSELLKSVGLTAL